MTKSDLIIDLNKSSDAHYNIAKKSLQTAENICGLLSRDRSLEKLYKIENKALHLDPETFYKEVEQQTENQISGSGRPSTSPDRVASPMVRLLYSFSDAIFQLRQFVDEQIKPFLSNIETAKQNDNRFSKNQREYLNKISQNFGLAA